MTKVIKYQDIYEFDLKKFFDTVRSDFIIAKLNLKLKLPSEEIRRLEEMFKVPPKLPEQLKMEEMAAKMKMFYMAKPGKDDGKDYTLPDYAKVHDDYYRMMRPVDNRKHLLSEQRKKTGLDFALEMEGADEHALKRGVPQGAPISPILSILALEGTVQAIVLSEEVKNMLNQMKQMIPDPEELERSFEQFVGPQRKTLMYADDGFIYGNNLKEDVFPNNIFTQEAGIEQNKDKSG